MEAKIRGVRDDFEGAWTDEAVKQIIQAVIAEALVYCTDSQDVPAEVAKRLDWQLGQLEKRAMEALEESE